MMRTMAAALLAIPVILGPVQAIEPDSPRLWLNGIVAPAELATIHTVSARAEVHVSDGTKFSTEVLYHDPQRRIRRTSRVFGFA